MGLFDLHANFCRGDLSLPGPGTRPAQPATGSRSCPVPVRGIGEHQVVGGTGRQRDDLLDHRARSHAGQCGRHGVPPTIIGTGSSTRLLNSPAPAAGRSPRGATRARRPASWRHGPRPAGFRRPRRTNGCRLREQGLSVHIEVRLQPGSGLPTVDIEQDVICRGRIHPVGDDQQQWWVRRRAGPGTDRVPREG